MKIYKIAKKPQPYVIYRIANSKRQDLAKVWAFNKQQALEKVYDEIYDSIQMGYTIKVELDIEELNRQNAAQAEIQRAKEERAQSIYD